MYSINHVLGYIPQQQGLYDDFTLNRFLWYMSALKGLKKKEAKDKITSLLDTVNLTDSAHKARWFFRWYETKSIDCSSVT